MSFPNEGNSTAIAASPGYVAISRRSLDLEDYIDLARRHVTWIVAPTFAGLVIAIVVAFLLPNTYISQAEMQITPSQISSSIVTTTVNQRLNERIAQMQQQILSRTTLSTIIQDPRLDLYKEERAKKPLEDVIEEMRTKDIKIQVVEVPGSDRVTSGSAFTISFQYSDAHKAQQVVQTLITKFEEENETTQRDAQTVLSSYVGDELTESKAKLGLLDDELTKFRVEHPGELPEQEELNIQELNSFKEQLRAVNDSMSRLAQDKAQMETRIDSLKHQRELLDMLDREPEMAAPVIRQQNERLALLNKQITDGEASLAQLKQHFSAKYPDVRDLEGRLAVIRKERDDLQKKQDEEDAKPKEASTKPKQTDYRRVSQETTINDNINAANTELQILEMQRVDKQKQQDQINKQINLFQQRLADTSTIEAKYTELVRMEKMATDTYQTNLSNSQKAEQSNQLLQRRAGEQLTTLDAPSLPQQPSAPKRWLVIGAGVGIAFIVGLALAGIQEARDTSLKNLKDVRAYTNLPVLSSIPLLENTMLVRRKRRLAYVAWAAGVIVGMLAITASLYYHSIKS